MYLIIKFGKMKGRILAALKTKHSGLIKDQGLGEKALLGMAAMLAVTVKEETEIETVVSSDGVVEALKGLQSEIDGRVTEAVKKAKAEKKDDGGGNTEPKKKSSNDDGDDDDDVKTLLKKLVQQNETLSEEINTIKAEKTATSLRDRVTSTLKEKKVDEGYITDQLDGRTFDSEESADAFVARIETGWGKLKQKFATEKLDGGSENPFVSGESGESSFLTNMKAAAKSEESAKE